jgi:hypothetical protein
MIRLAEAEGSLVISEVYWHDPYLSNADTPRYDVVNLEPEYDSLSEESPISTESSILAPVEDILAHFHTLKAKIVSSLEIRDYLYRFPEIAELSRKVADDVYKYFDFRTQLSLEIEDDEVPNSEYLVMYVRVPEYDNSVMDRIRKIRDSYYYLLDNTTGWFLLTTDFSPPR